MPSYQYRKYHCDKTFVTSSYLHYGNSCTVKTTSLYWISPRTTLHFYICCGYLPAHFTHIIQGYSAGSRACLSHCQWIHSERHCWLINMNPPRVIAYSYSWKKQNKSYCAYLMAWWPHQMETFSALLTLCAGNSRGTGEFPAQRPVTRSFDIFFDLRLNKRFSKQSRIWWFETLSRPLWRHCNGILSVYQYKASLEWWTSVDHPVKSVP